MAEKTFFTSKHIHVLLNVFQYFYLVSAILLVLTFVILAASGQIYWTLLPSALVAGIVGYGIYNSKPWAPLVVTLLAGFGIISNLLTVTTDPVSGLLAVLILSFEIYFFNRKDVKAHFKAKK